MYEVQMKHMNVENGDTMNFTCEGFTIDNNGYRFENILMDNFQINDFEVSNEDVAMIKIR